MQLQIREVTNPLKGRDGAVIDLLGEFTTIVPNAVMSRITGVPPGEDEARFCEMARAVIQGFMPFTSEEVQLQAEHGFQEMSKWVRGMVANRRAHAEEDLVTELIRAQDADDSLSEDDIVLLLASLIGAGSEATSRVATCIARVLLDDADILQRLRNDRPLLRNSLNEILRFGFSVPTGTMRFALCDFELRGKPIRKGQMIM